jgi:intracellular septation protein A
VGGWSRWYSTSSHRSFSTTVCARQAWAGIYLALIVGAVAPGISTLLRLIRDRTADGLAVFVITTMLLGVGVSLIAGSPRFLLAKEAWITGVAAAWFLISARGTRSGVQQIGAIPADT